MTPRVLAILFDLDGTLLNTLDDLTDSVNAALSAGGYPPRGTDEVRGFIGNGISKLIERAVPPGTSKEAQRLALGHFREYYGKNMQAKTRPYDGVIEMLQAVASRGIRMAVVSNKPDSEVRPLVQEIFGRWISYSHGDLEGLPPKPAPDGALRMLKALGVPADQTFFVGDSDIDIETAHAAGLFSVGCSWGFRSRETLEKAGADAIIEAPAQLLALL